MIQLTTDLGILERAKHSIDQLWNRNYLEALTFSALVALIFSTSFYISSNALVLDSDSGFEYANAQYILQGEGLEHGPFIQQLLYAAILGTFGSDYRSILYLQDILITLLVIVTFLFVRRKTDFKTAILASTTFLLFPVFYRWSFSLKPYPLFLLFLILSVFFFDRYLQDRRGTLAFSYALFLGLAIMTHLLAVPFLALPFLYYLLDKARKKHLFHTGQVARIYLLIILVLLPYLAWRLIVDGPSLTLLLTYPSRWHTIKYGVTVNVVFWGFPEPLTWAYFNRFWEVLSTTILLLPLVPFMMLGFAKYEDKALLGSWFFVLLVPYLVGRGIPGLIYLYPFLPFVVIAFARGTRFFLKAHSSKLPQLIIVFAVISLAVSSYSSAVTSFEQRNASLSPSLQDAQEFNEIIEDGSNVLFRSRALSTALPGKNVIQIQDLSEEDALVYLDWENDLEVARVFMKYNISYAVLYKDIRWERDYHIWFKLVTGREPSHYYRITESPCFEQVKEGDPFVLFRFLGCSQ